MCCVSLVVGLGDASYHICTYMVDLHPALGFLAASIPHPTLLLTIEQDQNAAFFGVWMSQASQEVKSVAHS